MMISCQEPSKLFNRNFRNFSSYGLLNLKLFCLNRTKETLSSGSLLSVINVLMQLRKVCNHPNLFEPRPIISPFQMESISYHTSSLVDSALDYDPFRVRFMWLDYYFLNISCINILLCANYSVSRINSVSLESVSSARFTFWSSREPQSSYFEFVLQKNAVTWQRSIFVKIRFL